MTTGQPANAGETSSVVAAMQQRGIAVVSVTAPRFRCAASRLRWISQREVEALVNTVEHAALRLRITFFDEVGRESHPAVVRQTTLVHDANGGVDRCEAEL